MPESLAHAILRHRKAVVAVFLALTVLGAVLATGVRVNPSMIDYLPPQASSTVSIERLAEEFAEPVPNLSVMINDVSLMEALEYKKRIAAVKGASDVTWLDDVVDLKVPLEMADQDAVRQYYRDGSALFSLTVPNGSSATIDALYEVIGDDAALTGDALVSYAAKKLTSNESTVALLISIPLILIVLLLTTTSWLEPLLFLSAIGVAVLVNMGSNIFFGEISFITNAVSPILQLAVSLDYAIFLLHAYSDFRSTTGPDGAPLSAADAMVKAMQRAFPAVIASALTTLFGFLALCFMRFGIGPNLGISLARGVALSFLSVMVFLPALALLCHKLIDRTRHRPLIPSFRSAGKHILKARIPIFAVVLVLIVPSFLAQSSSGFIFGLGSYQPGSRANADEQAIKDRFGVSTPMVVGVPRGDVVREKQLSDDLAALPHVTSLISYAYTVGETIPPEMLDDASRARLYSDDLARIILYTDVADEGGFSFDLVQDVRDIAASYYPESYVASQNTSVYDLKLTITADNALISWLAIVAICLVILFVFRSLSLPIILVLTIEAAIWINLSIPYFAGEQLQYIGYLVVSTVQLGATVDYAILYTERYLPQRRKHPPLVAARKAHAATFQSIVVSGSILSLAGCALWVVSSSPIVSTLGLLLLRGTLLSMTLVCCFLPCALLLLDRIIGISTLRSNFLRLQGASGAHLRHAMRRTGPSPHNDGEEASEKDAT
ncbi:MAG: MMPL family transporter [Coriobacteriales bacterium]|jgi:predicted RND superfamily exporter protein|nr:MMPL family transporter [Coriobacteriales bacterium]